MLDETGTAIGEERASKKQPLSDADAAALVKSVSEVVIARGKSSRTLKSSEVTLDDLRGHTGGFRAPMVRVGKTLLVGFSDERLRALLR